MGLPGGTGGKESTCNAGDLGSIPGLGRSPAEGKSYTLQYSGLENSGLYSPRGCKESVTTEQLSLSLLCVSVNPKLLIYPCELYIYILFHILYYIIESVRLII